MGSNINTSAMTTKGGLTPDQNQLPFSITTTVVENYLNKKLEAAYHASGETGAPAEVKIISKEYGKNFAPFVIVIPERYLISRGGHNNKSGNIPDLFNANTQNGGKSNYKIDNIAYSAIINPYKFDEDDMNAFMSDNWRHMTCVSRESANALRNYCKLRVAKFDNGRSRMGYMLIDPIRIFYDILKINGDNREFSVFVKGFNKQKEGGFNYNVVRVINSKNKQKNNSLINDLNRLLRSN